MLLTFFFTSSSLTKMGEARKREIDPEFKEGGQRNWYVLSFLLHCFIKNFAFLALFCFEVTCFPFLFYL